MMHKINSLFLSLKAGFNNVGSEQFLSSRRRIYKSNSYELQVEKRLNMELLMNKKLLNKIPFWVTSDGLLWQLEKYKILL